MYIQHTQFLSDREKKKKTQFVHSKYTSFKYVHYSIHSTFNVKNVQNYVWELMR